MAASPMLSWVYTRGAQSVRLVREVHLQRCNLIVYGPGTEIVTHEFSDVTECMKRQAEIEAGLQTAGYQFDTTSSERSIKRRISRGADNRHAAADRNSDL